MSEADLQVLLREAERIRLECDSPDKARTQLQSEGLLDANGKTAALYRNADELAWE